MTGPFLALAASLSWGVGDFLAGLSSRKLQLLTVLVVSQAAGLTSLVVLVAVRGSGAPEARYLALRARLPESPARSGWRRSTAGSPSAR